MCIRDSYTSGLNSSHLDSPFNLNIPRTNKGAFRLDGDTNGGLWVIRSLYCTYTIEEYNFPATFEGISNWNLIR